MTTTAHEGITGVASTPGGRRVRVLHVIDSLFLGGAEQLLLTLARHIDPNRFELCVCSLSPDDHETPISRGLGAEGIAVYRASHLQRHDLRHLPWLTRVIRQNATDLVHTHLPYGNVVGLCAAAASGRPSVSTLHSTDDRHRSQRALKRRIQGRALRGARVVIACSPNVKRSAERRFRIPTERIELVPNGIDCERFGCGDSAAVRARRRELLGEHAGPLVVAVGSVSSIKGHEHLIDATARLAGIFPGLRVVILGRNGDNTRLVRERIAAHRLEAHVLLAGQTADVPTTLSAADLFVHAALREGLPLAVLEAMAAGVPVVASTLGGIPSQAGGDRMAVLARPADPDALAAAATELLTDPDSAARIAARARSYVAANHDARHWAHELERTYARVIAVHGRGRSRVA